MASSVCKTIPESYDASCDDVTCMSRTYIFSTIGTHQHPQPWSQHWQCWPWTGTSPPTSCTLTNTDTHLISTSMTASNPQTCHITAICHPTPADQTRHITTVYGFSTKCLELSMWLILFAWSMTPWLFDEDDSEDDDDTPQLGAHLDHSTSSTGPTLQVQGSTPPCTEIQCHHCWLSFECDEVCPYQSLYHPTHCQKVQGDPGS